MLIIFNALLPVFSLIVLGYLLMRFNIIRENQWQGFERVVFYIMFPALITITCATADLGRISIAGFSLLMTLMISIHACLLLMARGMFSRVFDIDDPSFTSLFQGAIRWNTFVALALAGSLFGKEGLALLAVAMAVLIPLANIYTAYVMRAYGHGEARGHFLLDLIKNPFISSSILGFAINYFGLPIPAFIMKTTEILGNGALGGGLLLVGSGLRLSEIKRLNSALIISVFLKLVFMPFLIFIIMIIAQKFGMRLSHTAQSLALIIAAVPTAAAAFVMARQMGGNAPLMAAIMTVQTIVAAFTIPAILYLKGY